MDKLIKFLGKKDYLVGENLTWVDFMMFETCEFFDFIFDQKFYDEYPVMKEYHARIEAIDTLHEYKQFSALERPFNNKSSTLNN